MEKTFVYSDRTAICPYCGKSAKRHHTLTTSPHGIDGDMKIIKSVHQCECGNNFVNPSASAIADDHRYYSRQVINIAVDAVHACRTVEMARWFIREIFNIDIPVSTLHAWYCDSDLYQPLKKRRTAKLASGDTYPLFLDDK